MAKKLQDVFTRNLKAERLKAGLTQEQLAEKANVSLRYVQRLEQQGGNVTLESVEKFALALGCKSAELLSINSSFLGKRDIEALTEAMRIINGLIAKNHA